MDKEVRELEKALEQIWDVAVNKFGLDPFPTKFEVVPATVTRSSSLNNSSINSAVPMPA